MDFTNLLLWIVIGGIAGWLVSLVMKTSRSWATRLAVVVGIVGSLLGGFLLTRLDPDDEFIINRFAPGTLLAALVGTLIALVLWYLLTALLAPRKTR